MNEQELARKAVGSVMKIMLIKWAIIIGLNVWARRIAKKAL